MRPARLLLVVLIASLDLAAHAADLNIKVVDPRSAVVAGARVALYPANSSQPLRLQNSSAEGTAVFGLEPGEYRVEVLAPGFAPQKAAVRVPQQSSVEVQLTVAGPEQTVVVTATRTPVPVEESGAAVDLLDQQALENLQPVAASDAMRFLPGAVVNTAGQRGGLASLFVRGGDSTYNKVIVDGVTINEPGGTFDFGNFPLTEADRLEFLRGAQSTLYGSDAMTSVVQMWTRTGSTRIPELRFGADGGTFGTANGYAALSGARGIFDYDLFGDQFNTGGEGVNDAYSNSLQGANVGAALNKQVSLRIRFRHSNSFTGLPGEWNFNGSALKQPDPDEWKQLNNLLGSVELTVTGPSRWQHRFTGFDYNYRYQDVNLTINPETCDCADDFLTHARDHINRAGFEYQGDYAERSWAHTTFGYRFEDENGVVGDLYARTATNGFRLEHDFYGQQQIVWGRLSAVAGARFLHNSEFGNAVLPRVALTFLALRGRQVWSGTRLRFSYATGFKEPRLEETFAGPPFSIPNPGLKPERTRAFEAGFQQNLFASRYSIAGTYFNNLFYDRIDYPFDPTTFIGRYVNIDKSFAQGAEVTFGGRLWRQLSLNSGYTYTSTQILAAPACTPANFCDLNVDGSGRPLLRRPKNSATTLLTYFGRRWGGDVAGSFVGRRPDSDFLGLGIYHAAGYALVNTGGWFNVNRYMTAYVNVENVLNRRYNEVVGYPALKANFRAGMRFRIGGE
ncbi:MAG: TonB-dependent receptor domain-containing protein [Terriglobales bacterium]